MDIAAAPWLKPNSGRKLLFAQGRLWSLNCMSWKALNISTAPSELIRDFVSSGLTQ